VSKVLVLSIDTEIMAHFLLSNNKWGNRRGLKMPKQRILVIDDDKLIRWSLSQRLSKEGYEVETAEFGREGLDKFRDFTPDLTLLDLKIPDLDGMEILKKIKTLDEGTLVVVITAFGEIDSAVSAIKLGAYDYIKKPFNVDEMMHLIRKALETNKIKREVREIREQLKAKYGLENIIGKAESMQRIFQMVQKIAKSSTATVLIEGESGTGKDLIAKAIHYQSPRSEAPFIEVIIPSLPDTLIESELFGYEKGAFTDAKAPKKGLFELADGGTIFLDEIGDMSLSVQAKLLGIMEKKTFKRVGGIKDIEVDVRIIAATNRNLEAMVRDGRFREDLYYRLQVVPIHIPPLRERREDIPLLANYFMDQFNKSFKKNFRSISPEAEELLLNYSWPGNVRELRNVIERILILESGEVILPEHLPYEMVSSLSRTQEEDIDIEFPDQGLPLEVVERSLIKKALQKTKGNQTRAAQLLSITREILRYRMKKYGLL